MCHFWGKTVQIIKREAPPHQIIQPLPSVSSVVTHTLEIKAIGMCCLNSFLVKIRRKIYGLKMYSFLYD